MYKKAIHDYRKEGVMSLRAVVRCVELLNELN